MTKPAEVTADANRAWTCPTCQSTVRTPYCSTCGERALRTKDLTLLGLMGQLFHTLSSVDSRLLRSLRALITSPGALTNAYLSGQRKPYIGPFQLFLIVNVVFFAVQSFTGSAIFSTTLQSHLHGQDWSALAQSLVAGKLSAAHTTLAAYTPVFDQAVEVNAKSLVIVMVLPFALLLIPMSRGSGRPFVTHLVFALHLYAFLLVCFCVLLLFTFVEARAGGSGLSSTALDWGLFAALLAAVATYLYFAVGTVYGAIGIARALAVAVLTVALAAGILGYRFLIFMITLYHT
jgi:hypothetical protein